MKKTVIATEFHPHLNKWTGIVVEMGRPGTHGDYNIAYNGICKGEYFDTEFRAKLEADKYCRPKAP